jgi:hypothetical protein
MCIVEQSRTLPVGFGIGGKSAWVRQATTLLNAHIQTPVLAYTGFRQFFDKNLRVPLLLTLGPGNEYFCRPQTLKKAKMAVIVGERAKNTKTSHLKYVNLFTA